MKTPSISVLITYYGERELLTRCVESLINQTEAVDEILVYDDASPYPARDYLPEHPLIRVVRPEKNQGPCFGRNLLLSQCKSDYIHFHDADDWFHPAWCERVKRSIFETSADVIFTEASSYERDKLCGERLLDLQSLPPGAEIVPFCIQGAILPIVTTIRRQTAIAAGPHSLTLKQGQDFEFHVRLMANAATSFSLIADPLVYKDNRPGSQSGNRLEVWVEMLKAIEMLSVTIPKRYHDALAERAHCIGALLFQLGHKTNAKEAFALAARLGKVSFPDERPFYPLLATLFGPIITESVAACYRALFPAPVRRWLRARL